MMRRRWGAGAIAACGALLIACKSNHDAAVQHYAELACKTSSDEAVIAAAVHGYIEQALPKPIRFVYIPATDSSPPESGIQVLQSTGPTYMYSATPAQQAVVDKQLLSVGDYPTLLVAYHGLMRADPLHPVVKLSGHFVSGTNAGTPAPTRTIALQCDSTGWRVPEERGDAGTRTIATGTGAPSGR